MILLIAWLPTWLDGWLPAMFLMKKVVARKVHWSRVKSQILVFAIEVIKFRAPRWLREIKQKSAVNEKLYKTRAFRPFFSRVG